MYGRIMELPHIMVKLKNTTKCRDVAEIVNYGGFVVMVEKKHNIPHRMVDYDK